MITILIRTVIVYVLLILTVRLMGKRQLGELEISELVTTILISEIASLPIADPTIPIMHAIIPLVTIFTFEISLSVILLKCPRLKNLVSTRPSVLIRHGEPDQREMCRSRISIDELISEMRQAGVAELSEVDYAILEQNGKISILPKHSAVPPSAADLKIPVAEAGTVHVLIEDGRWNTYGLQQTGQSREALTAWLSERGLSPGVLFFLGINDAGSLHYIIKEKKR